MIKRLTSLMLVMLAVLAFGSAAKAQQMPLPVDPDVRIGQLPNGLTYYIRHNETPKGQADFYIAQKVGSILEEDNQRGLAHFLEHMCFNGTTHFPGKDLITYLESIGVKFGQNLNAYTSIDETVYNISNVPVTRLGVQDSCLLILHDWANDLLLEPEEIDNERGVIHQEWRRSMAGTMRIYENILPTIYPNNRYGERLPIGTMEVVDNFPYQALRDYYEAWYRPDQQGVVVVGDIDVDYIEGKIKEIFSDIEMPADAPERYYIPVEDNEGTIFAIGSDPEQTSGVACMMFKTDAYPDEYKGDINYIVYQYLMMMVGNMLDQRLDELGQSPDAPYASAGAYYDDFFVSKTKDAFNLQLTAKDGDMLPGFEAAYRELLRAARGGFTVGEYDRARAEYLSRLERAYNGRDKRQNESFVNEYVRNFIDNEPIMSIEDEYELMKQLSEMIDVSMINSILPELITNDNRVLMALVPANNFRQPTQADFEAIIAAVDAEDIEPYKDTMREDPLIPALPKPGKVLSVVDVPQWGAKLVTLSNGVKVYVKPTELKKDQILFNAIAVGGTSTIGDDQANTLIVLPYMLNTNGLGLYSALDINKYLQGKQCGVSLSISDYNREIDGSSTVKDLPTMMEMLYMTFVGYQLDPSEFAANQSKYASTLALQESNPQYIWQKSFTEVLYESAASQPLTTEIINNADREAIEALVHASLSNAADFTFIFVGDIDLDTLLPLLEQYVATLPADSEHASTSYVVNTAREAKGGKGLSTFKTAMETPQTWVMVWSEANMPFNAKNRAIASIMGQILSTRLHDKIREEMGAVYSIGASSGMQRQGEYNTLMIIPFPMKPELKDDVLREIEAMMQGMTSITAEELDPVKEYMVKEAIEGKDENGSWLNGMSGSMLNGVDTFNGNVEVIQSITTADVEAFVRDFLSQGNLQFIVLDPEEVPAE